MPQGGMGVLFRERIGGRGVTNVRACARPNFYPYRTFIRHHMQYARDALGQTPITDAPHLN